MQAPDERISARGFGGLCALEGDRIMRLVYMDEAGISNPKQEPWLVVSGVMVHADRTLLALQARLDEIVAKYIPDHQRRGFILHATELFNGGGKVFKRNDPAWPREKRYQIADELAALPKEFDLPLGFGMIERAKFPKTFVPQSDKDTVLGAHSVAFFTCTMQIEMWMRENTTDEVCLLIAEDNPQARRIITDTQNFHQNPDWMLEAYGKLSDSEERYFPIKKVIESPLFQTKAQSKPLQLADFCAYVMKRHLMGDVFYDRFFAPLVDHFAVFGTDPRAAA